MPKDKYRQTTISNFAKWNNLLSTYSNLAALAATPDLVHYAERLDVLVWERIMV